MPNKLSNRAIIVLLQQMAPFPWEIGRDFEPVREIPMRPQPSLMNSTNRMTVGLRYD